MIGDYLHDNDIQVTTPDSRREIDKSEFNLPLVFLAAPRRVLSREQLLDLSRLT